MAFPGTALSNPQGAAEKPVSDWACSDFIALDEEFYPVAVGLGTAVHKKHKPENAVLDVAVVREITPLIITECKRAPKESFIDKVRDEVKKAEKAVEHNTKK